MSIEEAMRVALVRHRSGRLGDAEDIYRQVLAARPDHVDALHLLGLIAGQTGKQAAGIELVQKAIAIQPNLAEAHGNLGNLYRESGKYQQALAAYQKAIALKPDFADAWTNMGVALKDVGRWDESADAHRRAIALRPDFAAAYSNLGNTFRAAGDLDKAIEMLRRSLELNPNFAMGHNNLANALRDKGLDEQAIEEYRRAIELDPNYAEAHGNLGLALGALGKLDDEAGEYELAIRLRPNFADPHWNLSHNLLRAGEFSRGWREYEWRFGVSSFYAKRVFDQPKWDGSLLNGKNILIYAEQGLGDTIQFARYLPIVRERAGKTLFQCPAELFRVLKGIGLPDKMIRNDEPAVGFDLYCPMMSLPGVLGADLTSIPSQIPYIFAESELSRMWKEKLGGQSGRLKVGIVWAGGSLHRNDKHRSMDANLLAPLGEMKDVTFISLQKGEPARTHPPLQMIDWSSQLEDFADTAALIDNLDLVLSVDTAVAHLAGAMGKEVWLMLPYIADWRWLLDRDDSPWYPNMRLFRQRTLGDWAGVVDRVRLALVLLRP